MSAGGEDAGRCRGRIRGPVAAVQRPRGLQFLHHSLRRRTLHGPVVPHVCQNLRLH